MNLINLSSFYGFGSFQYFLPEVVFTDTVVAIMCLFVMVIVHLIFITLIM